MKETRELPEGLVWTGEHLSDLAVTALADGEEAIVPLDAREHAASCAPCTHAIGAAALLAAQVGEGLAAYAAHVHHASGALASARQNARPPVAAILVAVALGALGALPALRDAPGELGAFAELLVRTLPELLRGGLAVLRASRGVAPLVSVVASAVLILTGLLIARATPRSLPA